MKKLTAGTQLNSNYESCQFYIGEAEAEAEANVNAKIGLIDFFLTTWEYLINQINNIFLLLEEKVPEKRLLQNI